MAWFQKKSDPISERARSLSDQIARLEAQIQALSSANPGLDVSSGGRPAHPDNNDPRPSPNPLARPDTGASHSPPGPGRPPERPPNQTKGEARQEEPVFEEVSANPFKGPQPKPPKEKQGRELGLRKSDFSNIWRRFTNNFRGPATSNPQLVKYIAAGSLQGLRPLRYEKRVARNRFILLLVCLILVLWGIIAIVIKR